MVRVLGNIWGVISDGVVQWISREVKVFDEILICRGDFCVFAGAQGGTFILERAGCEYVKVVIQSEFVFSVDDIKDFSAEVSVLGEKFYSEVWIKGGREIADEVIRKNENEFYNVYEEVKRVEEVTERARFIGIFTEVQFFNSFLVSELINIFDDVVEFLFLPELYNSEVDPAVREALDIIKIVNDAVDEAVNRLLNEVTEKVLKVD